MGYHRATLATCDREGVRCCTCGLPIPVGDPLVCLPTNGTARRWTRRHVDCHELIADATRERNRARAEARGDVLPRSFAEDLRAEGTQEFIDGVMTAPERR